MILKVAKEKNGITLIALVITIIVLLILAGVSIATLTGPNGLLTRANQAKEETQMAGEEELRKLTQAEATTHLEEYEYQDLNGEKVTIPAKCAVSQVEGENTLANGLVIIDSNGNEWVWIPVPKNIMSESLDFQNENDYLTLENQLKDYVDEFQDENYGDIFYSEEEYDINEEEYYNLKNTMLKSVYNNGGFYVGRYEVGTTNLRNTKESQLTKPVILKGAYPYNYVTTSQAQKLAQELAPEGQTSSLMFGIQWDLILKYIETFNGKTIDELNNDSKLWGNYKNASFEINSGMYSTDYGTSYNSANNRYIKNDNTEILLTTGATKRNSVQNIYDLAGNVQEITLERLKENHNIETQSYRGGAFNLSSIDFNACRRTRTDYGFANYNMGFRAMIVF